MEMPSCVATRLSSRSGGLFPAQRPTRKAKRAHLYGKTEAIVIAAMLSHKSQIPLPERIRRAYNSASSCERDGATGDSFLRDFELAKRETQTRREEHVSSAQRDAQTDPPDSFDAVVVELHRHKLRLGVWADAQAGKQMIFQPSTHAEKGEVMPLLHAQTDVAKELERAFRVVALTQLPAKIEQMIYFVAGHSSGLAH